MKVLTEIAPVALPVSWPMRRVRDVATLINGFPFKSEDFDSTGDVPLVRIRDLAACDFELYVPKSVVPSAAWLRNGDLAIGMDGDFNSVLWSRGPAALNQRVCILRPRGSTDIRFLGYVLPSVLQIINDLTYSTTVKHLSGTDVLQQLIPFPDFKQQQRISHFLDRETAQIDDLIAKQERLIELLAEKRQAVITHAVTKGLDPSAPTKPSGIRWLGDIPTAWKVSKLSWETRGIGDGLHGTPTYSDQGSIPFVNGTNLLGGEIRITDSTNFVEEDQLSGADMCLDESTVLISINGTIGSCAVLGNRQVMLSKSAAYIKCSESLDVHFLAHYLRSHPTRSYFFATSGGTTIANLSLAALRGTPIPVPPLPMQEEITKWLNEQIQSFDELGSKAYEAARLLRERRSALISAAVTGKIDVRKEPS